MVGVGRKSMRVGGGDQLVYMNAEVNLDCLKRQGRRSRSKTIRSPRRSFILSPRSTLRSRGCLWQGAPMLDPNLVKVVVESDQVLTRSVRFPGRISIIPFHFEFYFLSYHVQRPPCHPIAPIVRKELYRSDPDASSGWVRELYWAEMG